MSIKATNWAYAQDLPAPAKAVLVALAWRLNDKSGDCYPSRATLCAMTGLSRTTVLKAIRDLEAGGLLIVIHRRSGVGDMANGYSIKMPEGGKQAATGGAVSRAKTPSRVAATGGPSADPNKKYTTTKGRNGRKAQQGFSQEDWDLLATHEGGEA